MDYDMDNPFYFRDVDEMLDMVDSVIQVSTSSERTQLALALNTSSVATDGGAAGSMSNQTDRSEPLYSFLKLCDTIHDFARTSKVEDIYEWCRRPELMTVTDKHSNVRRGITLMEIKREDVLLKHLTKSKKLHFPSGMIHNPFYRKNVMKRFPFSVDETVEAQALQYRRSFRLSSPVVTTEIWMQGAKYKTLQLEQICKVFSVVKSVLGSQLEYIVDADEALARIVTTFPIIHARALRTLKLNPETKFIERLTKSVSKPPSPTWLPILCDASMYDASDVDRYLLDIDPVHLDRRPTKSVYKVGDREQIVLQGARYHKSKLQYKVKGKWVDQCLRQNSLGAATRVIDDALTASRMDQVEKAITMKRAGDWGQVENCRLRNRVLMTKDKMAAMYAIYRKVSVIYITQDIHASSNVQQWSFSIVKA